MKPRLLAIVGLVAVAAVGLAQLLAERRRVARRKALVSEYLDMFSEFVEKREFDAGIYCWLTLKANEVQEALGRFGIVHYKPPAASYMIPNYPVVINLLPEIRQRKLSGPLAEHGQTYRSMVAMLWEALVRYVGVLDARTTEAARHLRNPLAWLREGVRQLILLPMLVLHWFGLLGPAAVDRLGNAGVVRVASGIVTLVGFLSALATLVMGWDQLVTAVTRLLQWLF